MKNLFKWFAPAMAIAASICSLNAADQWVTYEPKDGPGKGKHIVMLAGDEEYRSEEALPMLGKILSQKHGFKCTVLFPINPADGSIDPNNQTNVPGMHLVQSADLVMVQFRFRELPDKDMKYFVDHIEAGKPVIAIRTSTHAFDYSRNKKSPYARYSWNSGEWKGGFGQEVLGDTWISHHGNHGSESARGLVNGHYEKHPILKSVKDVWGPTDVYGIVNLKPEDQVLIYGLTLKGMEPSSLPNYNKSIMPLVWTRAYKNPNGKVTQTLTSTIGAAVDLESEDLRRLFVNASYQMTGLKVPEKADVGYIGEFKPTFFGFNKGKKGTKPADYELK
ncbi:MAG: hypothetical protein ACO1QB_15730 [Verrucomicrobiales bacterium]